MGRGRKSRRCEGPLNDTGACQERLARFRVLFDAYLCSTCYLVAQSDDPDEDRLEPETDEPEEDEWTPHR